MANLSLPVQVKDSLTLLPIVKPFRMIIQYNKYEKLFKFIKIHQNQHQQYCVSQQFLILAADRMSRCQHGEMISIYCLNDACTWRQSGGCQHCFKRYHSHPSNVGTITQQKLDQLYRKMIIRPDPKVKSRILQEAVYNYFIIMKSQITSSLEAVSRSITSRLNYPYLAQQGQLQTFNKIKNKQYKKLNKKQLKVFCQFASENSKQVLETKQKQIYSEEIINLGAQIQKINSAFVLYSQAVKSLDGTFDIQRTFVDKINQIVSSIDILMKSGKVSNRGSDEDSRSKGKRLKQIDTFKNEDSNKLGVPTNKQRDRKVSIDITAQTKNRFDFKSHQNQLNQRKKRLMQIQNSPRNPNFNQIKVGLPNENIQIQVREIQKVEKPPLDRNLHRQVSADKGMLKFENSKFKGQASDQNDSEPRSAIVHTTIPREVSKPKLYEYSKDVKQKKYTIPVKISQQNSQAPASPILKKKKTLAQNLNKGINLMRIQSRNTQQLEQQMIQKNQDKRLQAIQQKTDVEDNMVFKQKQTDSLALLISSLSLSAEQAIPRLEAAIKYAHNNLSAAEYLSYLYLQIGKPKQCLTVCNNMLEQIQNSPKASQLGEHLINNKSSALNLLGRYSQSINLLQKAIQNTQKDFYFKNLGDAYFSISIVQKAIINYERAIKLNPQMDEALFNLSVCHYSQGHFLEAQLFVQRALKINNKNQSYIQLNKQINARKSIQ